MYETGNPVPSAALEDMADNAQTFDALVTKTEGTTTDRLGRTRRVFQQILMDMGFQPLSGSFQTGATLTQRNQCLLDSSKGTFYSWNGALPKVVPAGSTPATAGGIGALLWVDRTDLMLRHDLSSENGAGIVEHDRFTEYTENTVGNVLSTASVKSRLSSLSRLSIPRLTNKLNRYTYGVSGQQSFLIAGFGSSVGVGATLPDAATQAPVAKFFEYFQKYFNKGTSWPFSFVNDSVNGSIINDFSTAWTAQIATQTPDLAIFCYGMNDFFTANYNAGQTFGVNGFEQRLRNAIKTCHDAGCDVILFTSPHPHATRTNWSMPAGVAMTWPSYVAADVPDSSLYPPVSTSQRDYDHYGTTISVAERFIRGNECMRRVAVDTGCALIDIESLWFDAVAKYGNDYLFNSYESVHPNIIGHTLSYWLGAKLACESLSNSLLENNATSYQHESVAIGGTAIYANQRDGMVSSTHDGVKTYIECHRDSSNTIIRSLDSSGNEVQRGGSQKLYAGPYNLGICRYIEGLVAATAGQTITIALPTRKSTRIRVDGWSSAVFAWGQAMEILAYNAEGTITYNIMSEIDIVPTRRIFTVSTSGSNFIITVNSVSGATIRAIVDESI